MIVIDSAGWIAYFAGDPLAEAYEQHLLRPDEIISPSIVLYEVHKHVLRTQGAKLAEAAAALMQKTRVVDLDTGLALSAAEFSVDHRLPMADAIIYATARLHRAALVTSDKHFEGLPGVEYVPRQSLES